VERPPHLRSTRRFPPHLLLRGHCAVMTTTHLPLPGCAIPQLRPPPPHPHHTTTHTLHPCGVLGVCTGHALLPLLPATPPTATARGPPGCLPTFTIKRTGEHVGAFRYTAALGQDVLDGGSPPPPHIFGQTCAACGGRGTPPHPHLPAFSVYWAVDSSEQAACFAGLSLPRTRIAGRVHARTFACPGAHYTFVPCLLCHFIVDSDVSPFPHIV